MRRFLPWALALLCAALVVTAGYVLLRPRRSLYYTDGEHFFPAPADLGSRVLAWREAEELPLGPGDLRDPFVVSQGRQLFFSVVLPGKKPDLYIAQQEEGAYRIAALRAVDSPFSDIAPVLSQEENTLIFSSDRPGGPGGFDLYVSVRKNGVWQEPVPLPPPCNSPFNEVDPALSPDGSVLVFASDRQAPQEQVRDRLKAPSKRQGPHFDLFASRWKALRPSVVHLKEASSASCDTGPCVSPGGLHLYFASDRGGGMDLYRAPFTEEPRPAASSAERLSPGVNTESDEMDPALVAGTFELYYARASPRSARRRIIRAEPHELQRVVVEKRIAWTYLFRKLSGLTALCVLLAGAFILTLLAALKIRTQAGFLATSFLVSVLIHLMAGGVFATIKLARRFSEISQVGLFEISVAEPQLLRQELGEDLRSVLTKVKPPPVPPVTLRRKAPELQLPPAPTPEAPHRRAMPPKEPFNLEIPRAEKELRIQRSPLLEPVSSQINWYVPIRLEAKERKPPPLLRKRVPRWDVPQPPRSALPEIAAHPAAPVLPPQTGKAFLLGSFPPQSAPAQVSLPFELPELHGVGSLSETPGTRLSEPTPYPLQPGYTPERKPAGVPPPKAQPTGIPSPGESVKAQVPPAEPSEETFVLRVIPPGEPQQEVALAPLRHTPPPVGLPSGPLGPSSKDMPRAKPRTGPPEVQKLPSHAAAPERVRPPQTQVPSTQVPAKLPHPQPQRGDLPAAFTPKVSTPATRISDSAVPPKSQAHRTVKAVTRPPDLAVVVPPRSYERKARRKPELRLPHASVPQRVAALPEAPPPSPAPGVKLSAPELPPPPEKAASGRPAPLVVLRRERGLSPVPETARLPRVIPSRQVYLLRRRVRSAEIMEQLGGSAATENAVMQALSWLASFQSPDGRWDVDGFARNRAGGGAKVSGAGSRHRQDAGVTALAALAFLGAGYDHLSEEMPQSARYRPVVAKALTWLLKGQKPDGDLRQGGQMYDHALATAALCEACLMTGDRSLVEPIRKAVAFSVKAQSPEGGWRYEPGEDSDTSVLGWQMTAFLCAELAGFSVPPRVYRRVAQYLAAVRRGEHGGLYLYQTEYPPSPTMTAEGLYVDLLLHAEPEKARLRESVAAVLKDRPPRPFRGMANYYFWYYATAALFRLGGRAWETWNAAVKDALVALQRKDGAYSGSWDPFSVWGSHGGRVYTTAIAALTLEVYYRYMPSVGLKTSMREGSTAKAP